MSKVKPLVVGGPGADLSLDALLRVCFPTGDAPLQLVALDPAASAAMGGKGGKVLESLGKDCGVDGDGAQGFLSPGLSRAFVLLRLRYLLAGKGQAALRPAVAEFLAALLNAAIVPALPASSGAAADRALLAAFYGEGSVADRADPADAPCAPLGRPGRPLREALAEAGVAPPGLTPEERAALTEGDACVAAAAAAALARLLRPLAEASGALALEALGASLEALDAEALLAAGDRDAAAAASAARDLLAGSTLAPDRKGGVRCPPPVARLPATAGALARAASALAAQVRALLAGPAPAPAVSAGQGELFWQLAGARRAMDAAAEDALGRAALAAGRSGDAGAAAAAQSQLAEVHARRAEAAAEVARVDAGGAHGGDVLAAALRALGATARAQAAVALELDAAGAAVRAAVTAGAAEGEAAEGAPRKGRRPPKAGAGSQALLAELGDASGPARRAELAAALGSAWARDVAAAVAEAVLRHGTARKPKVAKGARDFLPGQMAVRERAFSRIVSVFKRHGAVAIDTPVFELRETLMGKYGEDSKLIYDLADQGGEILSLRYDLTVPFARFVALHGIGNIKRYHIGKVYRRDQPQMARGRFREFFQCDFDIAGTYPAMVPDAEVLSVMSEVLTELAIGDFEIKLSHRRLLSAMTRLAGVPADKFKPVCSAVDKLDKEPWEAVRAELTEEKGVPGEVADRLWEFVQRRGTLTEMLAWLTGSALAADEDGAAAIADLTLLSGYLDVLGCSGPVRLDLSLARGLEYYTGVIYEAVLLGAGVGSIAAGGRYDGLVGMFSGKDVPAVGASIGIERVFAVMEQQAQARGEAARETETEVLVASVGKGLQPRRMQLCARLWAAGVRAEFGYRTHPPLPEQLAYALKAGIPFLVIVGESELARGVVKVKDLARGVEEEVPEGELERDMLGRLGRAGGQGSGPVVVA